MINVSFNFLNNPVKYVLLSLVFQKRRKKKKEEGEKKFEEEEEEKKKLREIKHLAQGHKNDTVLYMQRG